MKQLPPIALLTDFGLKDHYVASLKGVIASIDSQIKVIDICHEVSPQNIRQGAFILREVFKLFPKGTIFVCVVDPGVGSSRRAIAVRHDRGVLMGPDNGLLSLALESVHRYEAREIACTDLFRKPVSNTFHGRDIFAPVAAHLAREYPFQKIGPAIGNIRTLNVPVKTVNRHSVQGEVIYIDQFGNGITNIDRASVKLKKISGIRLRNHLIKRVLTSFSSGHENELIAVWNSSEMLEFAVPNGSAVKSYKIKLGDQVKVTFVEARF